MSGLYIVDFIPDDRSNLWLLCRAPRGIQLNLSSLAVLHHSPSECPQNAAYELWWVCCCPLRPGAPQSDVHGGAFPLTVWLTPESSSTNAFPF
eukprot:5644536-Amphidinium_carterae.1